MEGTKSVTRMYFLSGPRSGNTLMVLCFTVWAMELKVSVVAVVIVAVVEAELKGIVFNRSVTKTLAAWK